MDERPDASRVQRRTLVLIGLTGAGKSTLGRRLRLPFVDSDCEIESAARMSIDDLFATYGETAFRRGEARVLARLVDGQPKVIAAGGGAVLSPETRTLLAEQAFTIWVRMDLDAIAERLASERARPVLAGDDMAAALRRLASEREPLYARADLVFDVDQAESPAVVLARQLGARLPWLRS